MSKASNKRNQLIGSLQKLDKPTGLYLHVPFCEGKCRYCDFFSEYCSDEVMMEYLRCLKKEIGIYSAAYKELNGGKSLQLKTIYIGGGTPSVLNVEQISEIINCLISEFSLPESGEITMEANPTSLNIRKVKELRRIGVNRLSVGVQSFNDKQLKFLGRKHSSSEAEKTMEIVSDFFDNFNIDLIFAVPGQSMAEWKDTLKRTLSFSPPHISLYNLQIEDDTPLAADLSEGLFQKVNDALDARMYLYSREILIENGYEHYEISNFARDGYQSIHNTLYWRLHPYLGVGPASHGFYGDIRYNNYSSIDKYCWFLNEKNSKYEYRNQNDNLSFLEYVLDKCLPIENIYYLDQGDIMAEKMFMGLRLLDGLLLSDFKRDTGADLKNVYQKEIKHLDKLELIYLDDERIKLTEKGILHANRVFMEFLP